MCRKAIWQSGRVRCIDDARTSKHNDMSSTHETIVCCGPDFPAISASAFASAFGHAVPMLLGCEDLVAAYRHIPNSKPGFTVFVVWDPTSKSPAYITLPGFNFGLTTAVVCFNRLPALYVGGRD